MITGECPECGQLVMSEIADGFERIICGHCDKPYWLYHSRLNPEAYTETEFLKLYTVDGKKVKKK